MTQWYRRRNILPDSPGMVAAIDTKIQNTSNIFSGRDFDKVWKFNANPTVVLSRP